MTEIQKKREKEQRIVDEMIALYCRKNHKQKEKHDGLCEDCRALRDYAWARSEKCPFMEQKTFCSSCKVHCYEPEMREKVRTVMRFSGPRMLLYHPVLALYHVYNTVRAKHLR